MSSTLHNAHKQRVPAPTNLQSEAVIFVLFWYIITNFNRVPNEPNPPSTSSFPLLLIGVETAPVRLSYRNSYCRREQWHVCKQQKNTDSQQFCLKLSVYLNVFTHNTFWELKELPFHCLSTSAVLQIKQQQAISDPRQAGSYSNSSSWWKLVKVLVYFVLRFLPGHFTH